jgi:hypothetical protein
MTNARRLSALTFAVAVAIAAAGTRVRTDDPVSSSVRFTGDIVRILDRKCLACHASQSLSMPLSTYRDVRAWGRAIREEVVEQRMPPWSVARGYGRFRNDLSLSARETATLLSWIDGGMARGDDRDLPPPAPSAAPAAAPDLRVALPPQRIPPHQEDFVRRVSVDVPIAAERSLARVVVIPGDRRVLRGASIFAGTGDRADRWVGTWLPWQQEAAPPAPHGFHLARGSRLTVELHYRGGDEALTDASAIEIFYASEDVQTVDEVSVTGADAARLDRAATVWAIVPSAGTLAESLQLSARRPDGSTDVLLWIPRLRREWPQALLLDRPVELPAGTALTLVAHPADTAARARLSVLR